MKEHLGYQILTPPDPLFSTKMIFISFQAIGNEKSNVREAVMDVMEAKLKAQFAQQQPQQAGASK